MKLSALVFLFLFSVQCMAQIHFVDPEMTWEQLSKKAKKEKKLIFIHIEGQDCQQCNTVATEGFSAPVLKEKFDKNFISTRVKIESKNGGQLATKFGLSHPLVSLFVNADGNMLNQFNGSTSSGQIYLQHAAIALERVNRKPLSYFETQYGKGLKSTKFIREYIERKRELSQPVDALLDEYAGMLTIDSLQQYQTIKFIYESGPTMDSRIYKAVQAVTPRKLIDSLYKTIPYPQAVAINAAIIGKSTQKAIQTKNQNLMFDVAGFLENSYWPDYVMGNIARQRHIAHYQYAVGDTAMYMMTVTQLLNFTHLPMSADSLRRIDESYFQKVSNAADTSKMKMFVNTPNFLPPSHFFHMELNEHAWHYYEMSDKRVDLEKALIWSKRSIDWFDELNKGTNHPMQLGNPAYLDTYAHLLYKLGRKEEAIAWQTKAVEAGKAANQISPDIEEALGRMKAGKL